MNKLESLTISNTKFVLILLVVALHSVTRSDLWTLEEISGSLYVYKAIRIIIGNILGTMAIPLFFFFSGYLYFYNIENWSKDVYRHKTVKRIFSLLLPYLLWNVIAALYFALSRHQGAWTIQSVVDSFLNQGGWHIFWDAHSGSQPRPADFPLWYMRDLMILCILTPLVYYFNKWMKWYWIVATWLGTCVLYKVQYVTGFGFIYFTIFSLGCYWGQFRKSLIANKKMFTVAAVMSLLLIVVIFLYRNEHFSIWLRTLFTLTGSITLIYLVYKGCERNGLKEGLHTHSAFFLYAIHTIGIRVWCDKVFTNILPYSSQNGYFILCRFFLAIALTVLVSMACYKILSIACPRVLKLLCGR